ncbi:hypothetical protein B0H17DRAFT_1105153 [Mycena rosella]|uniref:Uncharacterized protein n=1 Tax=Mycena rosella TaxID=1033263 RepID=A0AAD7C6V7_MYCRO|nr:hypothetical protein B0H17DRAFT_1105153 [Mycena rosella]
MSAPVSRPDADQSRRVRAPPSTRRCAGFVPGERTDPQRRRRVSGKWTRKW